MERKMDAYFTALGLDKIQDEEEQKNRFEPSS
jgi:hypothetical protein